MLVQQTEPDGTVSAAAYAVGDAPVEIVVDPDHRRHGKGRRILDELLADGEDRFWAHGDLPGRAGPRRCGRTASPSASCSCCG